MNNNKEQSSFEGAASSLESCGRGAKLSSGYFSAPVLSQTGSIERSISTTTTGVPITQKKSRLRTKKNKIDEAAYASVGVKLHRSTLENQLNELAITGQTINTKDEFEMMLDSPGRGPSKLVKNGKYLSYHKKVTQLGNTLSKNRDNMTKRQANSANKNNSIMSFSKLLNAN